MKLLEKLSRALHVSSEDDEGEITLEGDFDAISSICTRRRARCFGVINALVLQPRHANPKVEAELNDGTGRLSLVWLGREEINGIEPGTHIEVAGFVAVRGRKRIMFNPRYAIHGKRGDFQ